MIKINLAVLLAKKKKTRTWLSEETGIRFNTINDLYHEVAVSIKFDHIERICAVLECKMTDLLEEISTEK